MELQDLADAMIGFVGFGLNVEARKRLTIGVELAAKPQLLLFLDEPTSGLDGQSAFNIVRFLRKLAAAGQAILCTIHQPNAMLFENFGALLWLDIFFCYRVRIDIDLTLQKIACFCFSVVAKQYTSVISVQMHRP